MCSSDLLEQDWQNLTPIAIGMSFALFMLFTTIKDGADSWLYNKVILPISSASYGMYLMHMLMLPHWFGIYNPMLPEWLTIPATAISTYICCFGISWAIGKLPMGKYIVG